MATCLRQSMNALYCIYCGQGHRRGGWVHYIRVYEILHDAWKNSTKHQKCITVADCVSLRKLWLEELHGVQYICRYHEMEDDERKKQASKILSRS